MNVKVSTVTVKKAKKKETAMKLIKKLTMKASESEGEEEDVAMDEEQKQETTVDTISNIPGPFEERFLIFKKIRWLEGLEDAEQSTVIYNIQNASNSQLATLCEIAYNCIKGHIPLERWNLKELRKQRRSLRLSADSDADIEDKREEILRRDAKFVEILVHTINPL